MPWSSGSGNGGGGGGWKGGGNGGGPWGQGGGGNGGGGGRGPNRPSGGPGNQPPDLEELLKKSQDRLKQAMPGGGMSGPIMGLLLLLGLGIVGFYGFTKKVEPEERGIVLRFGKFDRSMAPGLNFRLPYPIETIFTPPVERVQTITGGIELSRDGFSRSSRGQSNNLMLTGDQNIVLVNYEVQWKIDDAAKYLFNIENPNLSVQEVAASAVREVVGKSEIEPLLTNERFKKGNEVQVLMQETLDKYDAGISIQSFLMKKVDPPAEVVDAFRDVQAARADKERLQNEAQSYANKVVPEARGEATRILEKAKAYKEQTIAESVGQADRFNKVFTEYKKAPEVTRRRMFLETMERVLAGTDKIILDSKGGSGVVPYLPLNELNKKKAGGQ